MSEILKSPYLQPYVNQYRPFADILHPGRSPEKPITSSRSSQRSMSGSQCSSISGSDLDSIQSSERNTSGITSSSNNTIDTESIDHVLVKRFSRLDDVQSRKGTPVPDLERQDSSRSIHINQHPRNESKHPKIIKKILSTLREDSKFRESNSPVRASRVKVNSPSNRERSSDDSKHSDNSSSSKSSDVTSHESAKVSCGLVKQGQASPPLKHLVRINVLLLLNHFLCIANFFSFWHYHAVTNC
jgi:NIMA (never in mitosis gene a)-related kinase 1/4/5